MKSLTVGMVNIKVSPNMKGFKKKVEAAVKKLRAVELDVNPDMNGFRSKVKAATKGMRATVKVDLDRNRLREAIRFAEQFTRDNLKIKAELDTEPLLRDLRGLSREMRKEVGLRGHFDALRGSIRNVGREIRYVTWETRQGRNQLWQFASAADGAMRRLFTKKDTNSAIQNLVRVQEAAKKASSGFGGRRRRGLKTIDEVGTERFAGLSRVGWIIAAISAIAAPLIQLVSGAVAALPALGLAAAAALGATLLGWQGITDAAMAAAPAVDRAKEALSGVFRERLTPQFQALGETLDKIQPRMVELAHGMSDFSRGITTGLTGTQGMLNLNEILGNTTDLFSRMEPFARDFTSGLLTMGAAGSRSFGKLSEGMNSFGANFRKAVQEMSADGSLQQAIESTYTVIGSAGRNIGSILRKGIETFTPEVAESVDKLFTGFAEGINGLLPLFSRFSVTIFPILGEAFSGIGKVGEGLEEEFATASASLATHAPDLEANSKRIKTALEEAFPETNEDGTKRSFLERFLGGPLWTDQDSEMVNKASGGLATFVEEASKTFQGWDEMLRGGWPSIKEKLMVPFQMFGEGVSELVTPIFDNIKEQFSGEKFREAFADAGAQLAGAFDPIKEEIGNAVSELGTFISEKWSAFWEGLTDSFSDAKTQLSEAFDPIKEEFSRAGEELAEKFTEIKEKIKEKWDEFWSADFSGGNLVTGSLGGGEGFALPEIDFSGFIASISAGWETVKTTVSTWGTDLATSVSTGFDSAVSAVSSAMSSIGSSISSGFSSALSGVTGAVSGMVSSVSSGFSSIVSTVASSVSSAVSSAVSGAQEMASGFISGVQGMISGAMGALGNLKSSITGFFAGAGSWLVSSGQALVQGFVNGIRSMIGAVTSAASSVVSAARAFFPSSPAKKGPFSGKGYTDHSGMALVKDFAKGMLAQKRTVESAAGEVAGAVHKNMNAILVDPKAGFEAHHRKKVLDPVLEANAKKIHDWRKRQEEAEKKSAERIDEINKGKQKQANKEKSIAKERERLAKSNAESYEKLLESLEEPDYGSIDRSIQGYWIEGLKEQMQLGLTKAVEETDLAGSIRKVSLGTIDELRKVMDEHPVFAQVEANVNAEHFNETVTRVIEESGIAYIPVEFVFSNLDQLKSDLGMGDGVVSRAIDQALSFDPSKDDARLAWENKTEIHYHVTDMEEAIRLEQQRERKEMMKLG